MAKKKKNKSKDNSDKSTKEKITKQSITKEMKDSYLDYAMSVIVARALPDVRDGLKPVHRRILFAMNKMGLTAGARFRKSAAVVGDVLGKYHPHGDVAVYDSMVKMAQEFSYRYPLVIGQGNFGSVDGDPPAAMRYTEAKMAQISSELLKDIEKETVEWRENYDGTTEEPVVFPSAVPNLLLNGTLGIAVGMASNIPPHNLGEVVDATIRLIDNPKATTDDLLEDVQGPDFPTGSIAFDQKDIKHAYANGRGGVVVRGRAEIVEDDKGNFSIVISSLPYRVNKADLIVKIADLVKDKKLEGIKDMRDESTEDIRIVIDLKSGGYPQKALNYIYKHTQLEDTFHYNMVGLVDGVPQTLSLKTILEEFIKHRQEVVKRRSQYDLNKAEDREHILKGLKRALDDIDEVIKTIKSSKDRDDAHKSLMKEFKLSDKQSTAILEMRLQRLAGLERQKIEDELEEIQKLIKKLKELLGSPKKILKVIKDELLEVKEKYGDERKTKIIKGGVKNIKEEDLIPNEENVLVLTDGGYIKRTNPSEYKKQKRGGVGVIDLNTKEEDFVTTFLTTTTHSDLLFFTDQGKVYQIKMYELPEGRRATRGKSIMNYLSLLSDEKVTSVLPIPKDVKEGESSLLMATKNGITKRADVASFLDVRRSGIIAIKLKGDDELISVKVVDDKDSVMIVTANGQSIHFKASDVRVMGRSAAGVKGINLKKGDRVVGAGVVKKGYKSPEILILSENGFGKKTSVKEYKVQKRGGSGIKTANVTKKTGQVISSKIVSGEEEEIIAMSKQGQVIRTELKEIPVLGRATQGVRIMKLKEKDSVASVVLL